MDRCDKVKGQRGDTPYAIKEAFNNCSWICYNKLDRRYRVYWKNQRDQIVERHSVRSMQ